MNEGQVKYDRGHSFSRLHDHDHLHNHEQGPLRKISHNKQMSATETTPLTTGSPLKSRKERFSFQINGTRAPLNVSDNVLLGFRANDLKNMAWNNFIVAILCLIYAGLNLS